LIAVSQTFTVAGLSCQSCVGHVTGALNTLPGVTTVLVELGVGEPSTVRIDADRHLDEVEVQAALAAEGDYTIVR
jgi:Cu+-exporting ATPase